MKSDQNINIAPVIGDLRKILSYKSMSRISGMPLNTLKSNAYELRVRGTRNIDAAQNLQDVRDFFKSRGVI